jgi:2,3-bisphosphoglycerate-independent phosphoglycerate mutase
MRVLFIFLDGVGLGADDPAINPLASFELPHLEALLGGRRLLAKAAPFTGERASLITLDACLGVPGLPQSATGQAVLLTGLNVPGLIGYHYGPKPNEEVAKYLRNGNIFSRLIAGGRRASLLNAYPPRYFASIQSGRRLYSAIPLAATSAGISLKTSQDLAVGQALSADFTGQGWREQLGIQDTPVFSPVEAGRRMAELSSQAEFSFFEYWASDYAGHHQDFKAAGTLLATFDQVLGGLVEAWNDTEGLILVTSDHGNMEDLSTRRHTLNPVPLLIIGAKSLREEIFHRSKDLSDVAPAILKLLISHSAG